MEPVLRGIFEEFADGKPVTQDFPRIPYDQAIRKYGSDKPDLRNPIEMQAVTAAFRRLGLQGVRQPDRRRSTRSKSGPFRRKTGGSRAFCDRMNAWAQGEGQPGLGYIFWVPRTGRSRAPVRSPRISARSAPEAISTQLGLEDGDAVFFVLGRPEKLYRFAGEARTKVGTELNLVDTDRFELCWIVDFPFYEWNEEEKRIDFAHNPFSMPQGGLEALNSQDPLTIKAYQYDAVCNGFEIASGSIRNQEPETMVKAFELTGYDAKRSRSSSAASTGPSSMAHRRMAAWRRASTASSC